MSQLKLVFGNKNYSTWSLRPWFLLKNLNIDFDEKIVFLFEENTDKLLEPYFSNSKVPVLVDGDLNVWDTLAIIEYIADKYPEKMVWPRALKDRALARSVSAEMHSSFPALRNGLPMNIRKHYPDHPITDDVQADIDRITALWNYCRQSNLTKKGSWLFGDFSAADAMYAPVVMRFTGYDVKLSGFAADYVDYVSKNQHMQDWIVAAKKETQVIAEDEI